MNRARVVTLLVLVLLGVAPLLARALDQNYLVPVFTRVVISGLAALSLNFILGYGGLVSFGHAAFLGLGAYTFAILSQHAFNEEAFLGLSAGPWMNQALVVWPLAMLVSALFSLLIGVISLRTQGVYFIMITLAFAQMLYFFFVSLEPYGGDDGLSLWWGPNTLGPLDLGDRLTMFYVAYSLLVICLFLFWRFVHARFGRVLRGLKSNELRMRALGYRPLPYRLAAFCIAGAVAGLAGALLGNQTEFVSPNILHWSRSGELLVMVILGGMGSLIGPVLGAGAFLLLEELLISFTEHWQLFFGPLLVLIVLFARRGLAGVLIGSDDD
ncbi:MAG TPA: branched-chain amino acid ABC transporter permease [Chloroflexota bacterium]|nr:branched-chain amino acid ABC transporter permease [Chloroflexota bacterium]